MKPSVRQLWGLVAEIAPPELAESWDNIGIQAGNPDAKAGRVMLALDLSSSVLNEALSFDVQMVVTHHPPVFHPLKNFLLSEPVPRLLFSFLERNIAVAAAHTNLDAAAGGVNDILAEMAGLNAPVPILMSSAGIPDTGIGRIGRLPKAEPAHDFITRFCRKLNVKNVMTAGRLDREVSLVAVCGGSGSSLWNDVVAAKADIFITGEIKHSLAMEAVQREMIVVDAGHWATEHPAMSRLASILREKANTNGWDVEFMVANTEKNPFVMQSF